MAYFPVKKLNEFKNNQNKYFKIYDYSCDSNCTYNNVYKVSRVCEIYICG